MRSDHFHATEIFEISHYLEANTVYGRRFVLELVTLLFCIGHEDDVRIRCRHVLKLNKHKTTKKDDIYVCVPLWTYWRCCRGVGSADVSSMPMFTRIEVTMSKESKRRQEVDFRDLRRRAKYPK